MAELTPEERTALVVATVEQTLRTAAGWVSSDKDNELLTETADAVKAQGADGLCCPVCDEIECDAGCPFETLRSVDHG